MINGQRWKIFAEPKLPKWAKKIGVDLKKENAWAMTWPIKREIHLAKELKGKPRTRDMALIHEILHATMPIDEKQRKQIMGPTVEERAVTYMAPRLVKVLKQLKWAK